MELVHQVDLDISVEGTTVELVEEGVTAWLEELQLEDAAVTAEVRQLNGPAGGWPVVRFRTPHWGTMLKLLWSYHDEDLDAAIASYDEGVRITL